MIRTLLLGLVLVIATADGASAQNKTGYTLDQQEKCASLARKAFNEEEASFAALAPKRRDLPPNFYDGHYNSKLDKCFMLVKRFTSYENKIRRTTFLQDAIEKRTYASYQEIEGQEKPGDCTLYPSRTNVNYCNTREEFDKFVARYMD